MPLLAFVPSCAYTAPYRRVETISAQTKIVVVTISAVEIRPEQRSTFFAVTKRVLAELPNQSGLLGHSLRFQIFGRKAWTMTAWKDQPSRDRFAASPIHRAAVKNSRVTAQNMRFVITEVPVSSLPMKWSEALRQLEEAPPY